MTLLDLIRLHSAAPSSAARRRPRLARPGLAARSAVARDATRRQADAAAGRASSIRCTSRRRPSASSSCTWPAGRRTWRRSTTSRSWPRCTASRCRSRSPRASRSPSSRGRSSTASAPQHPFKKYGKSGQEICELFPHLGTRRRRHLHHPLDEDRGDQPRPGPHVHEHRHDDLRPAGMGSWLRYGLGSESDDLPGFVVLTSTGTVRPAAADRRAAVAQRLPAEPVPGRRSSARKGDPVLYVSNPQGVDAGPAARRGRRRAAAQPAAATTSSTIPRSPRGSASTRWRSACRRACRS